MMRKRTMLFSLGFLVLSFGAVLIAQNRSTPATLDDLLSEIRGLRADIATSSSITVRSQLLVARMQIEEQRIVSILRQITEQQNEMAGARQMIAANEAQLKMAENELAGATGDERRAAELALGEVKVRIGPVLAQFQRRAQELSLRESELMNQLATEQSRWTDFNDRLDALERSAQNPRQ
jgi:hypothetical protein